MDSLHLSSDGFEIGSFAIPAFRLRAGECNCLHLPEAAASSEVQQLIRVLMGKIPLPRVRVFGRVHWAAPLRNRRYGLSGLFRPMRVADWLSRIAGASSAQARTILQQLHPDERSCRIEQLAGTPRTLLSIEGAWLAGAQVVIFPTAGLDPHGREAVYEAVTSRFPQGSAIHLSFPFFQNEQRMRQCFKGTKCLEIREIAGSQSSVTVRSRIK